MSIFGKLDAQTVSTNPFYIEAGEYSATVTKAVIKPNRDNVRQLVIEYTIDDQESEFLDSRAYHYFDLPDEDLDAEKFELLPADDKRKIRRNMATMKRTLCGNDSNDRQKGLGVPADDLNDENWNPEVIVGTKVNMGIANYGEKNQGVNVKWVNLVE